MDGVEEGAAAELNWWGIVLGLGYALLQGAATIRGGPSAWRSLILWILTAGVGIPLALYLSQNRLGSARARRLAYWAMDGCFAFVMSDQHARLGSHLPSVVVSALIYAAISRLARGRSEGEARRAWLPSAIGRLFSLSEATIEQRPA
ncbi:MAG: hypothetical protein HZC42_08210 [Candidatus Eisenbacteria bacterium]|nr:hypothetical protein [Candidatus Eisenbacteria bacterium]